MIYLVTEEGVYRHRILGVYLTQDHAESRAEEVANNEDGYHDYVVWKAEENVDMDNDPEEVCRYTRPAGRWAKPNPVTRSIPQEESK